MTKKPYLYKECGLDYVYLLDGYELHDTPYGKGISIKNIDSLYKTVAEFIIRKAPEIRGMEVRFIRKYLRMSQTKLAERMGNDLRTIQRWEDDAKKPISIDHSFVLKSIYLEEVGSNKKVKESSILKKLSGAMNKANKQIKITLDSGPKGWHQQAA